MRLLIAVSCSLVLHLALLQFYSTKSEGINSFQVDLFKSTINGKKSEPVVKKKSGGMKTSAAVTETTASETVTTGGANSGKEETLVVAPPAYPLISKRLGEEGEVVVAIKCEVNCQFELVKSSGFNRLDQAINDYMKKVNLADFKNKKLRFKFVLKD